MVKFSEKITNATKVHQTNFYVCVWKGNRLKIKLSLSHVCVSQIKVNDMQFDTFMKIPF